VPAFLLSFFLGLALVGGVRSFARAWGVVARPRADRWHRQATALLGGIAIWAAVMAGIVCFLPESRGLWGVLGAAAFLCAIGAVDDLAEVGPATKLVAQMIAAAVAVACGYHVHFFDAEILNVAASFLWIIAITNAVNLLDNMDGLAAGIVLIAAAYLGWSDLGEASTAGVSVMSFALAGSLAAFLFFNFNPASIFMGDSGSMFIGFLLSVLSLAKPNASNVLTFVAVPAATLLVPILDTTLVTTTRLLTGHAVSRGGRDHASHRLVMLGLSEREAVGLLWLLAIVAGASATLTEQYSYTLGLGLLPIIIVVFGLLGIYLSRLSFVEDRAANGGDPRLVRLALDLTYKRRVLEVLLDFVLIVLCYYLAYGFRFEFDFPPVMVRHFYESLPLVVGATMLAFLYQGVYRGFWSYVSTEDLSKYAKASGLAAMLSVGIVILVFRFDGYPRSVFPLFGILMFLAVGGTRVSFRLMDEALCRRRPGQRALLVGAGSGGEMAARELLRNEVLSLRPIGFIDDDSLKHGRRIHGYLVLGGTADLERIYDESGFEQIVVCTQKLGRDAHDRVRQFCGSKAIPMKLFRVELAEAGMEKNQ